MATGYHIFKVKRFPGVRTFNTQDQLFLEVDGISSHEPVDTTVTLTHEDFRGVSRYAVTHDYRARLGRSLQAVARVA